MIPAPNIDALTALLSTEPVRTQGDKRKPVRKIMDENADLFRQLADRGHTADKVVAGFLIDFPGLRESRRDLDDEGYRRHVRDSYISFRRALGVTKSKTVQPKRPTRQKVKEVGRENQPAAVAVTQPVPEPEKPAEKPFFPKPSDKGFPIPKGRKF